jgi:putative ABC transport system substrate-binding protein
MSSLGQQTETALVVLLDAFTYGRRDVIIRRAIELRIPTVYSVRMYVDSGGLASYGADFADQYRQCAFYADRILRGAKPSELPVQRPTKFELVLNLKTAKAMDLSLPASLLARADEVIE